MSWKELPDLLAVGLLIYAFVTVSRPAGNITTRLWLAGWICIEVHFAAYSFLELPGAGGVLADMVGTASLVWCAALFCCSLDARPAQWNSRALYGALALRENGADEFELERNRLRIIDTQWQLARAFIEAYSATA